MKSAAKKEMLEGTVQTFNISPKGMYEGVLLKKGSSVVQVNFRPEEGTAISRQISEGDQVTLEVEPEDSDTPSDHSVFALVSIHKPKGKTNGAGGEVKIEGKVARLNYARHGEINGVILDNGDFVHLKPEGAKALKPALGQTLSVSGHEKPSLVPHRVIEADTVNGKPVARKKH